MAALVCFWVYGGFALHDAYTYTDCGLWLWVSTLVSLILFPCMALFVICSILMTPMLLGVKVAEDGQLEQFLLGCGLSVAILTLIGMPAALVASADARPSIAECRYAA